MVDPYRQPSPPQVTEAASGMATAALVLGIVSWIFGSILTAIPGAIIGKIEMGKIARGESPRAGLAFAQIGFWASIVHIVVALIGSILFCCIWGGMLAAFFGAAGAEAM